ncbi:hypothetical protein [Rhodanobacter sp. FW106-PBR-LB-2-11]|uniref:hypothetical protein n=1 Tax=Rhodanobacter sp. FW106-PBR-LB-2-11 TaxID=1524463 RepID=UPI0034E4F342
MNASASIALPFRMPAAAGPSAPSSPAGWAGDLVAQVRKVARTCAEQGRSHFRIDVQLTQVPEPYMDALRIAANLFLRAFELASATVGRAKALLDPTVQAFRRRYLIVKRRGATLAA